MLEQITSDAPFVPVSPLSNSDNGYAADLVGDRQPLYNSALNALSIDESFLTQQTATPGIDFGQSATNFEVTQGLDSDFEQPLQAAKDFLTGQSATALLKDDLLLPQSTSRGVHVVGSLEADRFGADLERQLTVISGNGNIDYGRGQYDFLDLSHVSARNVVDWSPAESGGVIFNTGKGDRVFDSLKFSNGAQVLLEGLDAVKFSDTVIDLSEDPNDALFGQQWNLHVMGIQNAWRFTKGSDRILVGVQDSGLGVQGGSTIHSDLGKTIGNIGNVEDDFLVDLRSHGTSVHSIIGAASNNGSGMSGINWNSQVFNIDVIDSPRDNTLAQATQAMINQANQRGQKLIVNMSLSSSGINPAFEALVANNQNRALFVIASGNEGRSSISDPASLGQKYGNVIAVGASWGRRGANDGRAKNPGDRIQYREWGSNYGSGLSLMAPSEVVAATATNTQRGIQFGFTDRFDGTSAAAPNVAGVASLVWSINPNLSANQVHAIMAETAFDLGNRGYDSVTGSGFVNADAAVRRAMAITRQGRWNSSPFSSFNAMAQSEMPVETAFGTGEDSISFDSVHMAASVESMPMFEGGFEGTSVVEKGRSLLPIASNNRPVFAAMSVDTGDATAAVDSLTGETVLSDRMTSSAAYDRNAYEVASSDYNPLLEFSTTDWLSHSYEFAA